MKYQITQTITQTISKIVEVEDRAEAMALIEDADFLQSIEEQRMEEWEKDDEEWEVKELRENPSEPIYWSRKCDITGEGMDEGYCIQDGMMYIKYHEDLIKHLKEIYKSENLLIDNTLTEEFLQDKYAEEQYYYYTEWDDPEDIQYVETHGKVRLLRNGEKPNI